MRKPAPMRKMKGLAPQISENGKRVWLGATPLEASDCERLAAWLLKAAEWVREQEGK